MPFENYFIFTEACNDLTFARYMQIVKNHTAFNISDNIVPQEDIVCLCMPKLGYIRDRGISLLSQVVVITLLLFVNIFISLAVHHRYFLCPCLPRPASLCIKL